MAGRTLARTVLFRGEVFPKGTAETAELAEAVQDPKAWDGKPAPKKSAAKTDGQSE